MRFKAYNKCIVEVFKDIFLHFLFKQGQDNTEWVVLHHLAHYFTYHRSRISRIK